MGRAAVLAIFAVASLAGCIPLASNRCLSAGRPGTAAHQACLQADYAKAMQEMDYQTWLELTKGQMGTR